MPQTILRKLFGQKISFLCEIFLIIVTPLFLIYLFPNFIHYRLYVMSGGVLYIFAVMRLLKLKLADLGIQKNNFVQSFRALIFPTLLAILIVLIINFLWPALLWAPVLANEMKGFSIFVPLLVYSVVSVPVQEMLFRSYLIPRLEYARYRPLYIVVISASVFSAIHLPVGNLLLTFASFLLGVFWANNFIKYHNIFSLMLSHTLVGIVYIYLIRTM